MKHVYQLDEDDIIQVLADHYNCDRKDVTLRTVPVCVGYGPTEHMEHHATAEVEVKENAR